MAAGNSIDLETDPRSIVATRIFDAPRELVFEVWTDPKHLAQWWGPDGFVTTVRRLDVRPGGVFEYAMTAMDQDQVEAMKAAGLPLTSIARGTYTEVVPRSRLAFTTLADFIPGVAPYEVAALVEMRAEGKGVRMVVTEDAMHDAEWTQMSTIGLDQQFNRLGRVLVELNQGQTEDTE